MSLFEQPEPGVWRFPAVSCPHCGYVIDASDGGRHGEPPSSGAYSVCFRCTQPSIFVVSAVGVALRECTPEELAEYAVDSGGVSERLTRFWAGRRPES